MKIEPIKIATFRANSFQEMAARIAESQREALEQQAKEIADKAAKLIRKIAEESGVEVIEDQRCPPGIDIGNPKSWKQ
jgi:tRNA(Ser,Leu) C12 N-acetylase TAN1